MFDPIAWTAFFAVPSNITIWNILDSQFLTTLLAAVVSIALFYYERRAAKAVEATEVLGEVIQLQAKAKDKEDEFEGRLEALDEAPESHPRDYRLEASEKVQQAKAYLEELVELDHDKRRTKTYEKIPRHDYTVLALALHERNRITASQLSSAIRIFSIWNLYGRGRAAGKAVPSAVLREIKSAFKKLRPQ